MATNDAKFNLVFAFIGAILVWFLAMLLQATNIFPAAINLPAIGLFIGFLAGGFKDKLQGLVF